MIACPVCLDVRTYYGLFDPGTRIVDRTHTWFCSNRCMGVWMETKSKPGLALDEIKAMEAALPEVGRHVAEAGLMGKAFQDLERDEVLGLVRAVVEAYRARLQEVAGLGSPPF